MNTKISRSIKNKPETILLNELISIICIDFYKEFLYLFSEDESMGRDADKDKGSSMYHLDFFLLDKVIQ